MKLAGDGRPGRSDVVDGATTEPPLGSQAPAALLVLAGLFLAGAAQGVLESLPDFLRLPPGLRRALEPIWPSPGPVLLALVLFLLAATAFTYGAIRLAPSSRSPVDEPVAPALRLGIGPCLIAISGLVMCLFVLIRTARGYASWQPAAYTVAVGLVITAFVVDELAHGRHHPYRPARIGISTAEAIVVPAFTALFFALATWDLASWYYSSIGDEYNFRDMSLVLARGEEMNLFSQNGAYGIIPVLSSWVSGVQMRLFGTHLVGWKVSTIVPVGFALILYYAFARQLFDRRTALIGLGMMASSHYLLAYAHTGYPNLESILPMAGTLLFFVWASSRGSRWQLVAAGVCAGLGWYTFYSSRTAIFILGVAVVACVKPGRWWSMAWPVVLGFAMTTAPMVVTDGRAIISGMLEQAGGASTEPVADRALLPLWNLGRSAMAFNYNTHDGPFLTGSLAEPVTAAFFVLGLGLLLLDVRRPASRLVLGWFSLGIVATGVLSKYDYVSTSRLHFVVPAVCIIAALAVDRTLRSLSSILRRGSALVGPIGVAVVLLLVTTSNLYRWFRVSPVQVQSTADAVLVRILEKTECRTAALPTLVVDIGIGGAIGPALEALPEKIPVEFALYSSSPATWIESASGRCVVFRQPHDQEAADLRAALEKRWPGWMATTEFDPSRKTKLVAYYPARR